MGALQVKVAAVMASIILLIGGSPLGSALVTSGGEKSLLWTFGCANGGRKMTLGTKGSIGPEVLVSNGKKVIPFRCLGSRLPFSPPPAPLRNQRQSWGSKAPPPQIE
ncbi:hypothetical protein RJ641_009132 [Dillenia turbinata]|uniref:Uncharacterized protein n=1 Tax=Dillenia turbinata TaxID=194707 RepID=A0AAN8V767_9MAGN